MDKELMSGVNRFISESYHQTLTGVHSKVKNKNFVVKILIWMILI